MAKAPQVWLGHSTTARTGYLQGHSRDDAMVGRAVGGEFNTCHSWHLASYLSHPCGPARDRTLTTTMTGQQGVKFVFSRSSAITYRCPAVRAGLGDHASFFLRAPWTWANQGSVLIATASLTRCHQ